MVLQVQKFRGRLPEPTQRLRKEQTGGLLFYIDELIKTLRIRFESLEDEIDALNSKGFTSSNNVTVDVSLSTFVYLLDPSGNAITVNLPTAGDAQESTYYFKKTAGGGNSITISASGTDQIDGAANYVIGPGATLEGIIVYSDGTGWWILGAF